MKVQPVPLDPDCGIIPLLVADLIACDHCGIVAVDTPRFGWQTWTDHTGTVRHHCPSAAEYNEWVRNSLVHNVAPESAVEYEQWEHEDDQPELALPNEHHEALAVAQGAEDVIEKSARDAKESQYIGYADPPTAATDSDFSKHDWRTRQTEDHENLRHILHSDNPIFPPAPTDLRDDTDDPF